MPATLAKAPSRTKTAVALPTVKPITLGVFVLMETGVKVTGRASWDNYVGALEFAKRAHRSSGFWLADLMRYGDDRSDWRERLSQAQDATGLSLKTLANIRAVGAIPLSRRRDGVEFSHHAVVASLPAADQQKWLAESEAQGWSVRDLTHAIRHSERQTVIEGRALQMFTVDVTVQIDMEGVNKTLAEDKAWEEIKAALREVRTAKVVGAKARPT